ncbi:hypothetical protein B0H15DRAFT_958718 [Mycena belliarum]|uniref:Uncharacterized protein n=1 Tax=Mycena belliarum TaxID=1033014 RepID=A0AAD6TK30_9AGAR|nr:hypothetical protein B0H15DRAFT_958718 [Mycena belliae]
MGAHSGSLKLKTCTLSAALTGDRPPAAILETSFNVTRPRSPQVPRPGRGEQRAVDATAGEHSAQLRPRHRPRTHRRPHPRIVARAMRRRSARRLWGTVSWSGCGRRDAPRANGSSTQAPTRRASKAESPPPARLSSRIAATPCSARSAARESAAGMRARLRILTWTPPRLLTRIVGADSQAQGRCRPRVLKSPPRRDRRRRPPRMRTSQVPAVKRSSTPPACALVAGYGSGDDDALVPPRAHLLPPHAAKSGTLQPPPPPPRPKPRISPFVSRPPRPSSARAPQADKSVPRVPAPRRRLQAHALGSRRLLARRPRNQRAARPASSALSRPARLPRPTSALAPSPSGAAHSRLIRASTGTHESRPATHESSPAAAVGRPGSSENAGCSCTRVPGGAAHSRRPLADARLACPTSTVIFRTRGAQTPPACPPKSPSARRCAFAHSRRALAASDAVRAAARTRSPR